MEKVFGDQQCQSLFLYLEGIVVFSSSVTQHLVLSWLERERLKAKLAKCMFFQQEVSYLGHVISAKGVSTDLSKIRGSEAMAAPYGGCRTPVVSGVC